MTTTRERALEEALRDIRAMLAHAQDSGDDGVVDYIERADMALGAALPPSPPDSVNADMLAALQRLADVVEGGHYRNPIDLTAELDQARAAIARATGREG